MATSCAALQVCLAEAGVCGSSQARRSIGAAEKAAAARVKALCWQAASFRSSGTRL